MFKPLKHALERSTVRTVDEGKEIISKTMQSYTVPVRMIDVDSVADYTSHFGPHIGQLSGFGYSTTEKGMHQVTIKASNQQVSQ